MSISLKLFISNMDSPGMVYLKKKNELVEASEVDLHKLTLYKDYVFLPYIRDSEIYDSFLDHYHLDKEKKMLHKSNNFEVEFRYFIDYNKKYDHLFYDHYFDYAKDYLKPILIEWCKKNKITYIDDLN